MVVLGLAESFTYTLLLEYRSKHFFSEPSDFRDTRVDILGCLSIFSFSCLFTGCVSTSARWSTPTSAMVLPSPPLPSPSHSRHLEACNQTRSWGSLPRNWRLSKRPPSAATLLFSRFPSRSSSRRAVRAELSTSVGAACCVGPVLPRLFSHSPHKLIGKSMTGVCVHRTRWNRSFCGAVGPDFYVCYSYLFQLSFTRELHACHYQQFLKFLPFCTSAVPALLCGSTGLSMSVHTQRWICHVNHMHPGSRRFIAGMYIHLLSLLLRADKIVVVKTNVS